MASTFLKGTEEELMNLLKINYGLIVVEKLKNIMFAVFSYEHGKQIIKRIFKNGYITSQEGLSILLAIHEANLYKNVQDVFDRFTSYKLPKNFSPDFTFYICNSCEIENVHGYIIDKEGNPLVDKQVSSVLDGLYMCLFLNDEIDIFNSIYIVQQMIDSGMPNQITEDELTKKLSDKDIYEYLKMTFLGAKLEQVFTEAFEQKTYDA